MQQEKKVNAASLNQYLNGIRSYLAYYDVYVIPAKFKRKVIRFLNNTVSFSFHNEHINMSLEDSIDRYR